MVLPLSERWIQIGVTFVPIPGDLLGRKSEIISEAATRQWTSPVQIDRDMQGVFEAVRKRVTA